MELFVSGIANYLITLSASNPKIIAVLAIAYVVGLVIKSLRVAVEAFILESPGKDDDLKYEAFKQGQAGKILFFIADLLIRFKKPGI
jgi:hypothetical protein